MVRAFEVVVHYRDRTTQSLLVTLDAEHLAWLRKRIRSGESPETVLHGWEGHVKVCEVVELNFLAARSGFKRCTSCLRSKARSQDFHRNGSSSDGLDPRCKACKKEQAKAYWENNRDRLLERGRLYQKNNREYFRDYNRRYRKKIKDQETFTRDGIG